ncbi:hypothetical protein RUM43_010397 [Polyplax serrata]|uniref:Uncharacterized protein n=1 Tax=Polyplax serrata TaxID=468196 RepID=A0AAN8P7B5_POLSC
MFVSSHAQVSADYDFMGKKWATYALYNLSDETVRDLKIGFCVLPSLVSDVRDTEGHRAVDQLETVALKCSTSAVKKILTEDMDKSVLDSLVEEYE